MVSLIILSYNTKDLLSSCLSHLLSVLKEKSFEVIVVDNASQDGSVVMVREKFPSVKLIENKENVGFAKGNNIGAKHARGEVLCFLNSDTNVLALDIDRIQATFASENDIGIIGGRLQNTDGSPQRSYSNFYTLVRLFVMMFFGDKGEQALQKQEKRFVDWVSGGFMFIPKKLFVQVNGFDEQFFMYIEDMELCYRIKKKGFTVLYDPDFKAEHVGQGSSDRSFAIRHIYKGIVYFYKKHQPSWQYTIAKLMLLGKAHVLILFSALTGNTKLRQTYQKAVQF